MIHMAVQKKLRKVNAVSRIVKKTNSEHSRVRIKRRPRIIRAPRKKTKRLFVKRHAQSSELNLVKSGGNPILKPREEYAWESRQTFNPAALYEDGKVHLLYRALGDDGMSVVGYATSRDGIEINERLERPIFMSSHPLRQINNMPLHDYGSGGGWGGCEDPRITKIDERIYMTYVHFDGFNPPRIALTSIHLDDFLHKRWRWGGTKIISPAHVVDKSGCLFPEKINGKYVMLHRIYPDILIDFLDDLEFNNGALLQGQFKITPRKGYWDSRKIGAGAPPLKTPFGWLLIYYAVDDRDDSQYKIGAMLLDLDNPAKVLYRTDQPILEPVEWYENEGHKAGIVYPCGAVVIDDTLFVYYGGADTVVCVATATLDTFLKALIHKKRPKLKIR